MNKVYEVHTSLYLGWVIYSEQNNILCFFLFRLFIISASMFRIIIFLVYLFLTSTPKVFFLIIIKFSRLIIFYCPKPAIFILREMSTEIDKKHNKLKRGKVTKKINYLAALIK